VCSEGLGISKVGWGGGGSFLHEKFLSFSSVKNENDHRMAKVCGYHLSSQIAKPQICRLKKISWISRPSVNMAIWMCNLRAQ
jgi:hypothetical protein